MNASRSLAAGVVAVAVCFGAWGAIVASSPQQRAQDQPQPSPPPTFRTEANYVRVDVYPTRDDKPVADLTKDDFEVLDNGKPQKIEQFERVVVRAAGPQDARIDAAPLSSERSAASLLRRSIGMNPAMRNARARIGIRSISAL